MDEATDRSCVPLLLATEFHVCFETHYASPFIFAGSAFKRDLVFADSVAGIFWRVSSWAASADRWLESHDQVRINVSLSLMIRCGRT